MNDGSRRDDPGKPYSLPEGLFELHATLDMLPTFIYVKDRDLRVVSVNTAYCTALGVERSALLGQTTWQFLGDAGPESDRIDREVISSGKPQLGIVESLPSSDGRRWVVTDKAPILSADGEMIGLLGTSIDITEWKLADDERRVTQERLTFLTANMADILWTMDLEFRTIFVTPAIERVLGFTPDERAGQPLEEMVTPESAACVRAELQRQMEIEAAGNANRDRTMVVDIEYYRKDGSTVWMENVLSALRDAKGGLIGILGVARDIAARRAAERALHESEQLLRATEQLSRVGGWSYDVGADRFVWTRGVFDIYELAEDETSPDVAVGLAAYPGEAQGIIARAFRAAVENGVPYDLELPFVTARGACRWVRTVGNPRIEDGRVVRVTGNIMDITAAHKATCALAENEARYRALFELSKDAAYLIASDGEFLEVNDAWIDMFGYTRAEVAHLRAEDVYEDPRCREESFLPLMARDGAVTNWEIRFRRKDGDVMDCLCNVVARRNAVGEVISYQGLVRDITSEKAAAQALRESERRFRSLSENLHDGVVRFNPSLQVIYANEAAGRLFGMIHSSSSERSAADIQIPDAMRDLWGSSLQGVFDSGIMQRGQCEFETASGSVLLDWQMIPERGSDYSVVSILVSLRDVTDLRKAQEQLRRLTVRIQAAREDERAAIARELHDHFSQELTALKFDLNSLERILAPTQQEALPGLHRISDLVDMMSQRLRQLISEMRPGMLDDLGLCAALEWQASQFAERSGIVCALKLEAADGDLPPVLATALFRLTQEWLAEVARDAEATRATVTLSALQEYLLLTLESDGAGLSAGEPDGTRSIDLLGIEERIRACGGTVEISGSAGGGTVAIVKVPLPHASPQTSA